MFSIYLNIYLISFILNYSFQQQKNKTELIYLTKIQPMYFINKMKLNTLIYINQLKSKYILIKIEK